MLSKIRKSMSKSRKTSTAIKNLDDMGLVTINRIPGQIGHKFILDGFNLSQFTSAVTLKISGDGIPHASVDICLFAADIDVRVGGITIDNLQIPRHFELALRDYFNANPLNSSTDKIKSSDDSIGSLDDNG